MPRSSHTDEAGRARMVDVGGKRVTRRRAIAEGRLRLGAEAWRQLRAGELAKGDALAVAKVAGIAAAKRTSEWIPLCHPVPLEHVDVGIDLDEGSREVLVTGSAAARFSTGVEMEALVAVAAACLALYDMVKSIERGAEIGGIRLIEKSGGRSGAWRREARRRPAARS